MEEKEGKGLRVFLVVFLLAAAVFVLVKVIPGANLDNRAEELVRDYWRQQGATSCQIDRVSGVRILPKSPKEYVIIGIAYFADGTEYPFRASVRFAYGDNQGQLREVGYDPLRGTGAYNQPGFRLD